jgi:osmotically-inducible protein OsmY
VLLRIVLACVVLAGPGCGAAIDTTISDASITAAVTTALLNDNRIDGTAIDVRTSGAVVHLSGAVASEDDLSYVVALVRRVESVRAVESSIVVDPATVNPTPRP